MMDETPVDDHELIAHLDFATPTIQCESQFHAEGRSGCRPEYAASFVVEYGHTCQPGPWARKVVCVGFIIRIRGQANGTLECPVCRQHTTLQEMVHIIGPIE